MSSYNRSDCIQTETVEETVPGPTVTETTQAARRRRHRMFRRDTVTYTTSYYDEDYCYSYPDAQGCTGTVTVMVTMYVTAVVAEVRPCFHCSFLFTSRGL